ncbi:uncharacterized protein VTP21DRAFT_5126 [Calcarisporiella thermophila]|uniref:uncharacterized protein n=1 Tax=Calcarisporiella thermophila TaxID=911321 RepID=UPI003742F072
MSNFTLAGRKIVAIGRNFSEHAKELGNAIPTKPFFFLKPTSSYLAIGGKIEIPKGCEVHHEVELGVVIGKEGRDIKSDQAEEYIAGYALGIDMTARNLQNEAKKKGLPWTEAKGFDTFTPVGDFISKDKLVDPHNLDIWLKVNDEFKQKGNTQQMIFRIPQLIQHVSSIMRLEPGDLILTGTPAGVGPIFPGQTIKAGLAYKGEILSQIFFDVVERS